MVCKDCEKKLTGVACSDPFKRLAKNATQDQKLRKVGENKLLGAKKRMRSSPYGAKPSSQVKTAASMGMVRKCKICKCRCSQVGAFYCQECSYQKGICSMCGKKILDTSMYKMGGSKSKKKVSSETPKIGTSVKPKRIQQ